MTVTVAATVLGMLRGAVLVAVAYVGLLVLGALGLWALEGTPRSPSGSRWDPASALLFVTTLLTTVGKDGHGDLREIRDPWEMWDPQETGDPRDIRDPWEIRDPYKIGDPWDPHEQQDPQDSSEI